MLCAILLSVLAVVAGIVFWISILFLIIKSVKKQPKKRNIILSCGSAFAWLVFMILALVFGVKELVNGDSIFDFDPTLNGIIPGTRSFKIFIAAGPFALSSITIADVYGCFARIN